MEKDRSASLSSKRLILILFLCFAGLRKVYPYYFTFTTFTKGRWVGEKILEVFAREFRAHPVEEYVSYKTIFLVSLLLYCFYRLDMVKIGIELLV